MRHGTRLSAPATAGLIQLTQDTGGEAVLGLAWSPVTEGAACLPWPFNYPKLTEGPCVRQGLCTGHIAVKKTDRMLPLRGRQTISNVIDPCWRWSWPSPGKRNQIKECGPPKVGASGSSCHLLCHISAIPKPQDRLVDCGNQGRAVLWEASGAPNG